MQQAKNKTKASLQPQDKSVISMCTSPCSLGDASEGPLGVWEQAASGTPISRLSRLLRTFPCPAPQKDAAVSPASRTTDPSLPDWASWLLWRETPDSPLYGTL